MVEPFTTIPRGMITDKTSLQAPPSERQMRHISPACRLTVFQLIGYKPSSKLKANSFVYIW